MTVAAEAPAAAVAVEPKQPRPASEEVKLSAAPGSTRGCCFPVLHTTKRRNRPYRGSKAATQPTQLDTTMVAAQSNSDTGRRGVLVGYWLVCVGTLGVQYAYSAM